MIIVFRVDAYPNVGHGHLIRSIAIAKKLKEEHGFYILFAGTYSPEAQLTIINRDFAILSPLQEDSETRFLLRVLNNTQCSMLFIDNLYPYSESIIFELKSKTKVLLFHNLCEGRFKANIFILPSAHHSEEIVNDERWSKYSVDFHYGYDYIPISQKIKDLGNEIELTERKEYISITTGGSDPKGVMLKTLKWINKDKYKNTYFNALIGESFIKKRELKEIEPFLSQNINIRDFDYTILAKSKLAISTFGVTSYELLFLGIPFISISHAPQNAEGSKNLSFSFPLIKDLGLIDNLSEAEFHRTLLEAIEDQYLPVKFYERSKTLIDGKGIERIISIIVKHL